MVDWSIRRKGSTKFRDCCCGAVVSKRSIRWTTNCPDTFTASMPKVASSHPGWSIWGQSFANPDTRKTKRSARAGRLRLPAATPRCFAWPTATHRSIRLRVLNSFDELPKKPLVRGFA